jgi:hypothetical protein
LLLPHRPPTIRVRGAIHANDRIGARIESYDHETDARKITDDFPSDAEITTFVNPEKPAEAVLFRGYERFNPTLCLVEMLWTLCLFSVIGMLARWMSGASKMMLMRNFAEARPENKDTRPNTPLAVKMPLFFSVGACSCSWRIFSSASGFFDIFHVRHGDGDTTIAPRLYWFSVFRYVCRTLNYRFIKYKARA